jgi:hypothetical protein
MLWEDIEVFYGYQLYDHEPYQLFDLVKHVHLSPTMSSFCQETSMEVRKSPGNVSMYLNTSTFQLSCHHSAWYLAKCDTGAKIDTGAACTNMVAAYTWACCFM